MEIIMAKLALSGALVGPLNVRVVAADADEWWLNHADIKLRGKKEKKPLKAGDRVIVKVQPNACQFPVGTSGTVTRIDVNPPVYKVDALGGYWFYTREQLKRVKEEVPAVALAPKQEARPVTAIQDGEQLTCDVCGVVCRDPWHYSAGDRRHMHACDSCWPGVNTAPEAHKNA